MLTSKMALPTTTATTAPKVAANCNVCDFSLVVVGAVVWLGLASVVWSGVEIGVDELKDEPQAGMVIVWALLQPLDPP